jgi:hypothetical protein
MDTIRRNKIMLTQENTNGFTDAEIEQMNMEVEELMIHWDTWNEDCDYKTREAETIVLKKYGGA